jgi:hypothetical protein
MKTSARVAASARKAKKSSSSTEPTSFMLPPIAMLSVKVAGQRRIVNHGRRADAQS